MRDGGELAEKTLNRRLGVVGGLSILGTTGIVRPVSASAWTDTIEASLRVARAAGLDEVVLATGRTSEAAVQRQLDLPEEALVMMGDYLHYALTATARHCHCLCRHRHCLCHRHGLFDRYRHAPWVNTLRVEFGCAARAGAKGPFGDGPSALPAPLATISLKGALSRSC